MPRHLLRARSPGPIVYPWPPRPTGLIETAFDELARRWRPILDAYDEAGVDVCYEIHPGEDLLDGATFELFLDTAGRPQALLHQLRPLALRAAGARLSRVHRHLPRADQGVPRQGCGAQPERPAGRLFRLRRTGSNRAGRFRSLGDGQVDFGGIFSKLTAYDYGSWAVLEWECCLKNPEDGAREGAEFIARHIIQVTEQSFEDFRQDADEAGEPKRPRPRPLTAAAWRAFGRRPARRRPPLRLGMVGGGQGALIGGVHRLAARMDDRYELVAGCFVLARRSGAGVGAELGARPGARLWQLRGDGAGREAPRRTGSTRSRSSRRTICTAPAATAFLEAGIHVICDKPLTATLEEARARWRGWSSRPAGCSC